MPQLDEHTYHAALERDPAPALVIFTTPFCGACRRFKSVLLEWAGQPGCPRLYEVDAGAAPGLVDDLEVYHLPALFLYAAGRHHAPIHVAPDSPTLRAAVEAALARPAQDPP